MLLRKIHCSSGFPVILPLALRSLFIKHPFFALSIAESRKQDEVVDVPEGAYDELRRTMKDFAVSGDFNLAVCTLYMLWSKYPLNATYDFNALALWYSKSDSVTNLGGLVQLYREMKSSWTKPSIYLTFETLLGGMLTLGDLNEFDFIVNDMCEFGYSPSFDLLSRMLKKFIKLKRTEDSISILDTMLRFGYSPKEPTFFSLIRLLCKCKMVPQACVVFLALFKKGIINEVYSLGPIVWALCKSRRSFSALHLCYQMIKREFVMDVCLYTALIYGFCRERKLDKALWLLDDMQRRGRSPNVITYTILVKYYSDCGNIDEALTMLDAMEREGFHPDVVVYNILFRELCHQDRLPRAIALFEAMKQKDLSPDAYTISAFGGGMLKAGRVSIAYQLIQRSIYQVNRIDVVVYNIYLRCLCCLKRSREASLMLQKMKQFGLNPSNASFNTILSGFCAEHMLHEALKLLDEFKWNENGPNMISYNTILASACKEGDSMIIQRILSRMENEGISISEFGFMRLIEYSCYSGELNKSWQLMEIMMRQGSRPSVAILNMVLGNLCRNGLVKTATQVSSQFRNRNIALNTTSYNILSSAAIRERDYSLVLDLIREMLDQKLNPDRCTCTILIRSFCRAGKVSSAFRMKNKMHEEGLFIFSTATYNILMKTMIQRGRLLYALSLLQDMLINGCIPDKLTWELIETAQSKRWIQVFPELVLILEHIYIIICSIEFHEKLNSSYIIQRVGA